MNKQRLGNRIILFGTKVKRLSLTSKQRREKFTVKPSCTKRNHGIANGLAMPWSVCQRCRPRRDDSREGYFVMGLYFGTSIFMSAQAMR